MNAPLPSATLLDRACGAILHLLPDVEAVYAFGSVARTDAGADSDVDLAVLGSAPLTPVHRFDLQRELSALLDRDVDLVDLHRANDLLRIEATLRGRILYARNASRVLDFEARAMSDYAALYEATRELRKCMRERGAVYVR